MKPGDLLKGKKNTWYADKIYKVWRINHVDIVFLEYCFHYNIDIDSKSTIKDISAHRDDIIAMFNGWYPGMPLPPEDVDDWKQTKEKCARLAHTWIDTGMKTSWCKTCNTKGHFNGQTGQFEESTTESNGDTNG